MNSSKSIRTPSSIRKNDLIEHVKGYFPRHQRARVEHLAKKIWINKSSFRKYMLKPALQGLMETAKVHGVEPTFQGKKFFEKQLPHQHTVIDRIYSEGLKRQIQEQQEKNTRLEAKEQKIADRRKEATENMNKHIAADAQEKADLSDRHREEERHDPSSLPGSHDTSTSTPSSHQESRGFQSGNHGAPTPSHDRPDTAFDLPID